MKAIKTGSITLSNALEYIVYVFIGGTISEILSVATLVFMDKYNMLVPLMCLFYWPITVSLIFALSVPVSTWVWRRQKLYSKTPPILRNRLLACLVIAPLVVSGILVGVTVYLDAPPSDAFMRGIYRSHSQEFASVAAGLSSGHLSADTASVLLNHAHLSRDPTSFDAADYQIWTSSLDGGLFADVYSKGFAYSTTPPRSSPPNCSDANGEDLQVDYRPLGDHWYIYSYTQDGNI